MKTQFSSAFVGCIMVLSISTLLADDVRSGNRNTPEDSKTPAISRAQIAKWMEGLGSDSFAEREKATQNLTQAGLRAVPGIIKAAYSQDAEVRQRARSVMAALSKSKDAETAEFSKQVVNVLKKSPDAEAARDGLAALGPIPGVATDVVVTFAGRIGGSERILITQKRAYWIHVDGDWPENISLGNVNWSPKNGSLVNHGDTQFLPTMVDLKSTQLTKQHGRGAVRLERYSDYVVVQVDDKPQGRDMYKFELVLTRPALRRLRIVAVIDGTDQLHINAAGARWVHRAWQWPGIVRLNQLEWLPEKTRELKNVGKTKFLDGPIDFSSARLRVNKARDAAILEQKDDEIIVHFADNPSGSATYDVTVLFGQ